MVCECERLAKGAQRPARDTCACSTRIIQRIRDVQPSSKGAVPVVAQRSATVPARDPALAEMKRGPRIRIAVDGVGVPSAQRADDEGKNRAHQMLDGTSHDLRTVVYDIVCRWRGGAGRPRGGQVHTCTISWYMYMTVCTSEWKVHMVSAGTATRALVCKHTPRPRPPVRAGR